MARLGQPEQFIHADLDLPVGQARQIGIQAGNSGFPAAGIDLPEQVPVRFAHAQVEEGQVRAPLVVSAGAGRQDGKQARAIAAILGQGIQIAVLHERQLGIHQMVAPGLLEPAHRLLAIAALGFQGGQPAFGTGALVAQGTRFVERGDGSGKPSKLALAIAKTIPIQPFSRMSFSQFLVDRRVTLPVLPFK